VAMWSLEIEDSCRVLSSRFGHLGLSCFLCEYKQERQ